MNYETRFDGRFVITGFDSVGRGVLPLLLRHIDMRPEQVTIVNARPDGLDVAEEFGVKTLVAELDRTVPPARRPLPRHLHRTLAGCALEQQAAGAAHQLCVARSGV